MTRNIVNDEMILERRAKEFVLALSILLLWVSSGFAAATLIKFDEEVVDLGNIVRSPLPLEVTVKYTNITNVHQQIKGAAISCGCSSFRLESKKLLPNASSKATVTINRAADSGFFKLTLGLDVVDQDSPSSCVIIGRLITPVKFNPIALKCSTISSDNTVEVILQKNWLIGNIEYDHSLYELQRLPMPSDNNYLTIEKWKFTPKLSAIIDQATVKYEVHDGEGNSASGTFPIIKEDLSISFQPNPIILRIEPYRDVCKIELKVDTEHVPKDLMLSTNLDSLKVGNWSIVLNTVICECTLAREKKSAEFEHGKLVLVDPQTNSIHNVPLFIHWLH